MPRPMSLLVYIAPNRRDNSVVKTLSIPSVGDSDTTESVALTVPNIVLGIMRTISLSDTELRSLVGTALDVGVVMFDHADRYGPEPHACERQFGGSGAIPAHRRGEVILQSKVGIRQGYFDFSREHIVESARASLAALGTDYLDVLLLHRPDALVEPDEVAAAFDELAAAGDVRHFGVSNHTPGQIELLRRSVRQPLRFHQLQFGLGHPGLVSQGITANMQGADTSNSRDLGALDYARLHGQTVQAWSPFQHGFFEGVFLGDRVRYPELNALLDDLAAAYHVTPTAIATAWITRHPAHMQVVLGTTRPERVREAAAGSDLPLTRPEWYALYRAAGQLLP